ncbi:SRR1-like protein [Sphaceloma murrayae]|uniref:SRR1-like protein n=1 Tax=Sphaceloma murrayae TaxID=2082308 RepID=A0A2K1QL67_9PEZI|nr:SRR1-like protein [Sphaceloma murrayae]
MQDDSIIIWDDESPPSSPFISEVGDASRAASKSMIQHVQVSSETKAIFEGAQQTPVASSKVVFQVDKENAHPEDQTPAAPKASPFKTPFENAEPTTSARPTPSSTRGRMLPPSTIKRASSPAASTAKRPSTMHNLADDTPSRPKSSRTTTAASNPISETNADDTIDDTCFSTFSAVPDMTLFSKLRPSPTKPLYQTHMDTLTPSKRGAPSSRSPSPTPRRPRDETTSLLIDFTGSVPVPRNAGLSPSRTESHLMSYINASRSPPKPLQTSKPSILNLLDFELPPPPTPRSAPSFSAREVEALKSGFASQIGSVKARLSGKEAEAESLKKALEDAERRVGEAEEAGRLERIKREEAEREKESWERRGEEVERVLGTVRGEVGRMEGERAELVGRCEEAERRAEAAERRVAEVLGRMGAGDGDVQDEVQRLVQAQLDQRIESVSRELHGVYKRKHEMKVATLKKSYEARGEKRVAELQGRVEELVRLNDELKVVRDEGFSGEVGGATRLELEEKRGEVERLRAMTEEQVARVKGLETEMEGLREDHARVVGELEVERVEKGELVAAVDEMLALQATDSIPQDVVEDFRKSLSRPSGLRAPAPGAYAESRLAKPSGLARAGSGKSKMMSNIERMGGARGIQ